MHYVYRCLTTDIISLYTLNKSWHYIESPDFAPVWHETVKATAEMGFARRQFPFLLPLFDSLPEWIVARLSPNMILTLNWQKA